MCVCVTGRITWNHKSSIHINEVFIQSAVYINRGCVAAEGRGLSTSCDGRWAVGRPVVAVACNRTNVRPLRISVCGLAGWLHVNAARAVTGPRSGLE